MIEPKGLGAAGKALWRGLTEHLDFDAGEAQLLCELARTADTLDRLAEASKRAPLDRGLMSEARQQRITYARLHAALRLPEPEDELRRPQRRTGVRRPYRAPRLGLVGGVDADR